MSPTLTAWTKSPPVLRLPPDEVHVWRASLSQTQKNLQFCWEMLAEDERQRAERFHFERDRHHFIAARGILRQLLGQYLNVEPRRLYFKYTSYGKPFLANTNVGAELRFNVSHSGELALYAFSRPRELGVDIEKIRPDIEHRSIAKRFFSEQEVATLFTLPVKRQRQAFFLCWTRKEAYIKAIGEGLSLPLHTFDVSLVPGEPAVLLAVRGTGREAERWTLRDLQPGADYEAALVAEGNDWHLKCWQWT
ncbi:MAG TPA: 4'-phosphopantetheinyl transferase superfamily protein [Pyrinomonadaceae bacterium]|jgi:4'-phosphopantetheinyl transferase